MLKECRLAGIASIEGIQDPDLMLDLVCDSSESNVLPLFYANELAALALSILPNHAIVDEAVFGDMLVIERRRPIRTLENFCYGSLASRTLQIVDNDELVRSLLGAGRPAGTALRRRLVRWRDCGLGLPVVLVVARLVAHFLLLA